MPKKIMKDEGLDEESSKLLCDVLKCVSEYEQQCDVLRQFLCVNEMFEPY